MTNKKNFETQFSLLHMPTIKDAYYWQGGLLKKTGFFWCPNPLNRNKVIKARQHKENPSSTKWDQLNYGIVNEAVETYTNCFVEIDDCSYQEQIKRLDNASIPTIPSIVMSGDMCPEKVSKLTQHGVSQHQIEAGKSLHMFFAFERTLTQEEWLRGQRALIFALGGDPAIKNPARLMRYPIGPTCLNGTAKRSTYRIQTLLSVGKKGNVEEFLQWADTILEKEQYIEQNIPASELVIRNKKKPNQGYGTKTKVQMADFTNVSFETRNYGTQTLDFYREKLSQHNRFYGFDPFYTQGKKNAVLGMREDGLLQIYRFSEKAKRSKGNIDLVIEDAFSQLHIDILKKKGFQLTLCDQDYIPSLKENLPSKTRLIVLANGTGRGKTKALRDFSKKKTVTYVSPKRSLVAQASKNLSLTDYRDSDFNGYNERMGICINSLEKVEVANKILAFDELCEQWETLFNQVSTLQEQEKRNVFQKLISLGKQTETIILSDANITAQQIEYLTKLWEVEPQNVSIFHDSKRVKTKRYQEHKATIFKDSSSLFQDITNRYKAGENIYVACATKTQAILLEEYLYRQFRNVEEPKIRAYYKDCDEDVLNDLKDVSCWKNYRVVIASPIISSGVSFEDEHFDCVALFADQRPGMVCDEIIQMIGRVRCVRKKEYLFYGQNRTNFFPKTFQLTRKIIQELPTQTKKSLRKLGFIPHSEKRISPRSLANQLKEKDDKNDFYTDGFVIQKTIKNIKSDKAFELFLQHFREGGGDIIDKRKEKSKNQELKKELNSISEEMKEKEVESILQSKKLDAKKFIELKEKSQNEGLEEQERGTFILNSIRWNTNPKTVDKMKKNELEKFVRSCKKGKSSNIIRMSERWARTQAYFSGEKPLLLWALKSDLPVLNKKTNCSGISIRFDFLKEVFRTCFDQEFSLKAMEIIEYGKESLEEEKASLVNNLLHVFDIQTLREAFRGTGALFPQGGLRDKSHLVEFLGKLFSSFGFKMKSVGRVRRYSIDSGFMKMLGELSEPSLLVWKNFEPTFHEIFGSYSFLSSDEIIRKKEEVLFQSPNKESHHMKNEGAKEYNQSGVNFSQPFFLNMDFCQG